MALGNLKLFKSKKKKNDKYSMVLLIYWNK